MGVIETLRKLFDQSFRIPKPPLTEQNVGDLDGKVYIVTGANSGVGYELTSILYSCHAKVYVAARSEEKAKSAISTIESAHPNSRGALHYLHLDLADLSTIKASADEFLSKEPRLHWLCNNAGISLPSSVSREKRGKQDHEIHYATNVLGPFLFTKLLLPVLERTAKDPSVPKGSVRVSWPASFMVELSPKGGVNFVDDKDAGGGELVKPNEQGKWENELYAQTKVANFWLAKEFGMRFGVRDGVIHNAYNPGNLLTPIVDPFRAQPGLIRRLSMFLTDHFVLQPPRLGAYTELYCGLSGDIGDSGGRDEGDRGDQGAYVVPWGRVQTKSVRSDVLEASGSKALWEWCERETKAYAG